MTRPELSLPAGSLQCALYAFKGGADSVYFGMKTFSARAGAVNFSFEDLRKIARFCYEQGKKFYITINTLIKDSDIPELLTLLKQISYTSCSGIIIQDLGVAKIIKDNFPNLPLHASTQLAVYNADGVKALQELGFSRVVLARELSLEEIRQIRKACPDIELKVFIHGAMCYGFSGLCMASEHLTGRSANCGACAQICRTWFTVGDNQENRVWCFSMKDLALGERILEYAKIGIDSLKIEGRMKSPEYVYNTALYYSKILDYADNPGRLKIDSTQIKTLKENVQTTFSRETTSGFFNSSDGSRNTSPMITKNYPSHIGLKAGTILRTFLNRALVNFEVPVSIRDGLLAVSEGESAGFSLTFIESGRSFAGSGTKEVIGFPTDKFKRKIQSGAPLYITSRHNMTLPLLNENLPLFKQPIDIKIEINDTSLVINGKEFPVRIEEAKTIFSPEDTFSNIFSSSDKSCFTLGKLKIENNSGFKSPFIPVSALKQARRSFYAILDEEFESRKPEIKAESNNIEYFTPKDRDFFFLHPLNLPEQKINLGSVFNERKEIVLNNISQLEYAKKHPENNYYLGTFLYAKNSYAYSCLKEQIPNLSGIVISDKKDIPLFISRVCFRHHSLGLSCKDCSRNNTFKISQNGHSYTVHCKNCITEVYGG